jgi:hypothetical protein
MPLTTARRQMANRLLNSGSDVLTFAAGWAAGSGVDRLLPRAVPGRLALVLGSALVGALTADELFFTATGPLRDRLREPATTLSSLPATLTDARRTLAADTTSDAEHEAAFRSYTIDRSRGLVSKVDMWSGHPDGSAALFLGSGCVLCFRRVDDLGLYELARADTPETVEITSLAQLLQLLPTDSDPAGALDDEDQVLNPDLVLEPAPVD